MQARVRIILIAMLFISTYTAKAQNTPLQLNDRLVSITDSLFIKSDVWANAFSEATKDGSYSKLKAPREDMEKYLVRKLAALKIMKDVGGAGALRQAMINFLNYERNMISRAIVPAEKLKRNATEAEIKSFLDKLSKESQQEDAELKKVATQQAAYARRNGFALASSEQD